VPHDGLPQVVRGEVLRLKARYPGFIRNSGRSLALMLPPHCERVTAACPAQDAVLPLWMGGDHFVTPFCCYGNDVDCARCGAWVVFSLAAKFGVGDGSVAPQERARRLLP